MTGGERRMHEHHHEETIGAVIRPISSESYKPEAKRIGVRPGKEPVRPPQTSWRFPRKKREVPKSPQQAHEKPGRKNAMALSKCGNRKSGPAKLFEKANYQAQHDTGEHDAALVFRG